MPLNATDRALLCWCVELALQHAEPTDVDQLENLLVDLAPTGVAPYAPFATAADWHHARRIR